MGYKIILLLIFCVATLSVSETLIGESNTFTFPEITTGLKDGLNSKMGPQIGAHLQPDNNIEISWSLPENYENGQITIYNVLGRELKTFSIDKNAGSLLWSYKQNGNSKGVFLATIKSGELEKKVNLLVVR